MILSANCWCFCFTKCQWVVRTHIYTLHGRDSVKSDFSLFVKLRKKVYFRNQLKCPAAIRFYWKYCIRSNYIFLFLETGKRVAFTESRPVCVGLYWKEVKNIYYIRIFGLLSEHIENTGKELILAKMSIVFSINLNPINIACLRSSYT